MALSRPLPAYSQAFSKAGSTAGRVLVRDTENRAGAVLAFAPQTWREFAARIKNSAA
jgi:hypothetical protein